MSVDALLSVVIETIHKIEGGKEDRSPVAIEKDETRVSDVSTQLVKGPGGGLHLFGLLGNALGRLDPVAGGRHGSVEFPPWNHFGK
jgi:hypothetical protein